MQTKNILKDSDNNSNNVKQPEPALDPAVERVRIKLMWFMIISTIITFVLVFSVVAAIIYKVMRPAKKTGALANTGIESSIILPQGIKLISQSLSGDRLMLEVINQDGKKMLIIYDIYKAKEISRLTIISPEGGPDKMIDTE